VSEEFDPVLARMPTAPTTALPAGACDTHTHVFGPFDRHPVPTPSSYAPPIAPPDVHAAMMAATGLTRAIIVQPAPYGTDNAALLDALRQRPDTTRGVAVLSADASDQVFESLTLSRVKGLRFNEMRDPRGGGRYKGSIGLDQYLLLAPRMKEHGLVPHVWAKCATLAALLPPAIRQAGQPFVIDHLTGVDVDAGVGDPAFQTILGLLRDGMVWVKLSLCRNSADAPRYDSQRPFHDALLEANPDRLLWGSDWPFVRMYEKSPDIGTLLDVFAAWTPDAEQRRHILVDNPARLYGFKATS
jgi:2-pyrone-4,6-dicarboxylate lactonase